MNNEECVRNLALLKSLVTLAPYEKEALEHAIQALTQGQVVYQLLSNDGTWTDTVKEVYDIPSEVKRRVLYTHPLVVTDEIGEVRENGVVWFDQNPHAYPVGTKFYAALQKQLR